MSKTYAQVMKQIDVLKAEAEKLRRQEVDGVIARIREAVEHYGLTAADLGLRSGPRSKAAAKPGKGPAKGKAARGKTGPANVKYRDDAGHVWGGRGPRPQWLRDALAAGRQLEEFAVR